MVQLIGQITNADVYINEVDVAGRVAELDMGEIAHQEVKHETLGMIGVMNLPGRPVQEIGAKISFEWLDDAVMRDIINPTKRSKLQLHSFVDVFDSDGLNLDKSHILVTHIGFLMMKTGDLKSKLGDQMGITHDITVASLTQKVYGESTPVIEFDVFAQIYKINGENVWWR